MQLTFTCCANIVQKPGPAKYALWDWKSWCDMDEHGQTHKVPLVWLDEARPLLLASLSHVQRLTPHKSYPDTQGSETVCHHFLQFSSLVTVLRGPSCWHWIKVKANYPNISSRTAYPHTPVCECVCVYAFNECNGARECIASVKVLRKIEWCADVCEHVPLSQASLG